MQNLMCRDRLYKRQRRMMATLTGLRDSRVEDCDL